MNQHIVKTKILHVKMRGSKQKLSDFVLLTRLANSLNFCKQIGFTYSNPGRTALSHSSGPLTLITH